jgi:hypothetical protein
MSELVVVDPPLSSSQQRDIIKADLIGKFQREDWHGVMDCAADLREHDAYHRGWKERDRG